MTMFLNVTGKQGHRGRRRRVSGAGRCSEARRITDKQAVTYAFDSGHPGGIGNALEGPGALVDLFSLYLHSRDLWEDEVRKPSVQ